MFAYCGNNPVNNIDYSGQMFALATKEERISIDDGAVGGSIPIPIDGVLFDMIDHLWDSIAKSYARSVRREYRSTRENHHLVAKESKYATLAAAILYDVFPGEGP